MVSEKLNIPVEYLSKKLNVPKEFIDSYLRTFGVTHNFQHIQDVYEGWKACKEFYKIEDELHEFE